MAMIDDGAPAYQPPVGITAGAEGLLAIFADLKLGKFQLKWATARFELANRKSWSTPPPPFPAPAKWPGGVVLEVLRRRKSVRADVTTCAEGPPS